MESGRFLGHYDGFLGWGQLRFLCMFLCILVESVLKKECNDVSEEGTGEEMTDNDINR